MKDLNNLSILFLVTDNIKINLLNVKSNMGIIFCKHKKKRKIMV